MEFDILQMAKELMLFMVPFLFSLCFHEYAHGWVARKLGDQTAFMMGRLTMNPMAHADPLGTFLLPAIGILTHAPIFGWANPVPINERNLKNPRRDLFWIAAAGPASNLLLATLTMFGMFAADKFLGISMEAQNVFLKIVSLNLVLAIFNLIPIHPLDGGKILARFISPQLDRKLEESQSMFGIVLMMLLISGVLSKVLHPVLSATMSALAHFVGLFFS